jgi:methyl-accepting chemotaxis protein
MTWTIGRRIALALFIELALLVVVAIVGARALGKTFEAYEAVLVTRRATVVPAMRVESDIRGANVEQYRLLLANDPRYERSRDSLMSASRATLLQLRDTVATQQERDRWSLAITLLDQWNEALLAAGTASRAGDQALASRIRATRVGPQHDVLEANLRAGSTEARQNADGHALEAKRLAESARRTVVIAAVLAIVLGITTAVMLSRSITRPLQETATIIASSSSEILAATTEQAAGTNQSMAAVTETVATVDEVAQTAAQAVQRARIVADAAQRTAEGGRAGQKAVGDAVSAMGLVQAQVEAMASAIVALAEQAQAIGEITTAVSDIAEQTKLLALNAAVESTRAGEHGRGFALVAAEIKTLAGEAKDSTVQVRRLLSEIQRSTSGHGHRAGNEADRGGGPAGEPGGRRHHAARAGLG